MTSKAISIIFSVMLFFSLAYLAGEEYYQSKAASNQIWWALYFEDPKGSSLDAVIENHGKSANFRWEIYLEKNLIAQNSADIEADQQKKIPITTTELSGRKVTIKVFKEEEKRELYKTIR